MRREHLRRACVLFFLSAPLIASAQSAPTDFKGLANLLVQLITATTAVVIAFGVVYYLWGIAMSIKDSGSAKAWEQFRVKILWGLFALFIMFSVWGLVRVLGNTLFAGSNFTSYGPH